jgi:hypothetical protein
MEQVMKFCFKCERGLPLSEFYKHPQMKDGHLNKCKDCTKKDAKENRNKNIEYYRQYDRDREYRKNPAYLKKYRAANKQRTRAHRMVSYHVSKGNLTAQPCERCGTTERVEAHHEDYSKPLDVMWLCSIHHKARHKELEND